MNYRHAYHAGNFADVFKHALLTRILLYLMRKDAPLRYLDTHSGVGRYDLSSEEALRTGEWRDGIGRLMGADLPPAAAAPPRRSQPPLKLQQPPPPPQSQSQTPNRRPSLTLMLMPLGKAAAAVAVPPPAE
jgi:hypothetical protein